MAGSPLPPPDDADDDSRVPAGDAPGLTPVKLREVAITALITGGVAALFTMLADGMRELGPGLTLLACAVVGLALAIFLTMGYFARLLRRVVEPLRRTVARRRTARVVVLAGTDGPLSRVRRRLNRFLLKLSVGYVGLLLGAAVVIVPWGVVQGGTWLGDKIWPPDCDRPLQLRVITAQENIRILRERADQFVRSRLTEGCAPYAITVEVAPSTDELAYAFSDHWYRNDARQEKDEPFRRLYGPRADAWIATSTGEARLVDYELAGWEPDPAKAGRASLHIGSSVASDRLVIGIVKGRAGLMTPGSRGGPGGRPLAELWQDIHSDLGMSMSYPEPELSTAGLIAVAGLRSLGDGVVDRKQGGIPAENVSSLLCQFNAASEKGGDGDLSQKLALVIPSHSLDDYNNKSFDDAYCQPKDSNGSATLSPFFAPELSRLDYPFVTITWAKERSEERAAALTLFRDWLVAHPLFDDHALAGLSVYDAERLRQDRDWFFKRLPPIRAEIAIDASGSMAEPQRSLLVRLREAFPGVNPLIIPRDDFGLSVFYTMRARVPSDRPRTQIDRLQVSVGRQNFDQLTRSVIGMNGLGSDAPISEVIKKVNREAPSPRTLIVITDGGPLRRKDWVQKIDGELARATNVADLYVLVLGDNGCTLSPKRQGKYRDCVDTGPDIRQKLRDLIGVIRAGGRG